MKTCKSKLHSFSGKRCKECEKIRKKNWRIANPNYNKEYSKIRYHTNPEVEKARVKNWKQLNSEKDKICSKNWQLANPDKCASKAANRRAQQKHATPSWLTKNHLKQIQSLYSLSATMSKITGVKHHVDHIYPLNGINISGLHVPWNLRITTADINFKKSNKLIII